MAETRRQLVVPQPANMSLGEVPEFMQQDAGKGAEELGKFVQPPVVRVIQGMTDPEVKKAFGCGVGDVIVLPSGQMINKIPRDASGEPLEEGGFFLLTPVYFYVEYIVWNDRKLKGTKPLIRERTFNESELPTTYNTRKTIGEMCRNASLRIQQNPDNPEFKVEFVEHMNYICAIPGVEMPCIVSFARAEYTHGQKFANLLATRTKAAPMFGCQFAAYTGYRTNNKGGWWGLDIVNPPIEEASPYVADQETYQNYSAAHEFFKEKHEGSLIRADFEGAENVMDEVVSEAEASM